MRRLTVSALYRPRRKGGSGPVPHLRLTGQWLANHGFTAGSKITVTAANGILILSHSCPMNILPFTLPTREERLAMHARCLWRRPRNWRFHLAGLLHELLP